MVIPDQRLLFNPYTVLNWARGSSSPYNMSRTDKATLASIATGFTGSSGQAQAILRRVFDEVTGADYSGDSTRARMSTQEVPAPGISHFALYPNPANEGVFFVSANMPGLKDARAAIKVYDLTGKRRLDVERRLNDDVPISINLEGLGNGIYFMELQLDGFPAQFQKLIIE